MIEISYSVYRALLPYFIKFATIIQIRHFVLELLEFSLFVKYNFIFSSNTDRPRAFEQVIRIAERIKFGLERVITVFRFQNVIA